MHGVTTHRALPFSTLSVTLTLFQGHSSVKQFQLKILCSYPFKLKLCRTVMHTHQAGRENTISFEFRTYSREIIDVFPKLTKCLSLAFSRTLFERVFFELCIIIALLVVCQFIPGLVILTFKAKSQSTESLRAGTTVGGRSLTSCA